jgi:hypothetical protein
VNTLAANVSAFLEAEGHLTRIDTPNETATAVRFRTRGLKFTVWVLANDDGYLQLSYAMSLEAGIVFDAPLLRALWNRQERIKCVKFSLEDDDKLFVCSTETFFATPDGYQATFWRSVGVIETALYEGLSDIRAKHSAQSAAQKFIAEFSHGSSQQ